ncbi:MAG: oxidoreductase domain protein [Paenibacillaceae bacterium]|jgi:predicted dehydrogenase|nr:oxidoreductase domain protein [Paenibacillaceae bacterium]
MKIGICGAGRFGQAFIPLFKAHPLVDEVVLADLVEERRQEAAQFGITRTFGSLDELCASDVDAIAIFAQRQLHGPMAIQALKAGKHVYCAVPMASKAEEITEIIRLVEQSRLIYMNGETSYYYPSAVYCRQRFRAGDFGEFVYGEGNYLHDMEHGFYQAFQHSGGDNWKQVAGFPPMFYPTHSTSLVLSVTGARATTVSCVGYVDRHEDGIFQKGGNLWDNPFSNQSALMQTSDGGMLRINEFRRVGWWSRFSGNPMTMYGTKASYEENSGSQVWTTQDRKVEDLTDLLHCARNYKFKPSGSEEQLHEAMRRDFDSQFAKVQPVHRLPRSFVGLRNGHLGSHQFLVDDFAKAVVTGKLPPVNAWEAAKYVIPGLIAHDSCLRGGERLDIPDFGRPPAGWDVLDPDQPLA